jgi:HAD superfamily hydrolase (TIGR01509 family)
MNDIKFIIFDCDGVLVDSEIIGIRIEVELLHSAGCAISVEQLTERFSGMSWGDILLILEKESGLNLKDQLLSKTEAELDERIPAEVRAMDGVRVVLEQLQYPRCVCSNTKMSRLEAMLTNVGLKDYFAPNIFSAKDLGEGRAKPKPDIFLLGAERMGFDPSQTLVVEDSVHGVQAARAAGMRVIGFTGGSHTYPDHSRNLLGVGALKTISHMRDLPTVIARIIQESLR